MIFPNLALWGSPQPDDAAEQIDRALHDRNHRLSAGLSINRNFDLVRGALVVTQGNGKYLRIRHVVEAREQIPASIRNGLKEIFNLAPQTGTQPNTPVGQLAPLLADLSNTQAAVVEKLKCEAGKYVDRVLAVSVCDPGYWAADFDGRVSYSSLCDPAKLAEACGVSVIDALPSADLAVGGSGQHLEALPVWMLFADRNAKVANQVRGLLSLSEQSSLYLLPASDGLDAEIPQIHKTESIGFGFLDSLTRKYFPVDQKLSYLDRLYADGTRIPGLQSRWQSVIDDPSNSDAISRPNGDSNTFNAVSSDSLTERLVEQSDLYLKQNSDSFSNVIRTGISWVLDLVLQNLQDLPVSASSSDSANACLKFDEATGETDQLDELFVACSPQYEASVINQLGQRLPGVTISSTRTRGISNGQLDAVVSAVLGLFLIDQMPSNIPWLTRANSQRILGRLTPGRASNWRQLLRVMADFHPAPMKLRDAI